MVVHDVHGRTSRLGSATLAFVQQHYEKTRMFEAAAGPITARKQGRGQGGEVYLLRTMLQARGHGRETGGLG